MFVIGCLVSTFRNLGAVCGCPGPETTAGVQSELAAYLWLFCSFGYTWLPLDILCPTAVIARSQTSRTVDHRLCSKIHIIWSELTIQHGNFFGLQLMTATPWASHNLAILFFLCEKMLCLLIHWLSCHHARPFVIDVIDHTCCWPGAPACLPIFWFNAKPAVLLVYVFPTPCSGLWFGHCPSSPDVFFWL